LFTKIRRKKQDQAEASRPNSSQIVVKTLPLTALAVQPGSQLGNKVIEGGVLVAGPSHINRIGKIPGVLHTAQQGLNAGIHDCLGQQSFVAALFRICRREPDIPGRALS